MVNTIEKAMGEDIQSVTWMGADTKAQAIVKLHAITNRIGYPDKWRDYSTLKSYAATPLGNSQRANQHDLNAGSTKSASRWTSGTGRIRRCD